MARAATEPGLWTQLAGAIRPPRAIAEAAGEHAALYRELLAGPTDVAVAEEPPARRRRPSVPRPTAGAVSPARA